MAAHAKRSASGAHRWAACPGSLRLVEELERELGPLDTGSEFAFKGTVAHAASEVCLTQNCEAVDVLAVEMEGDQSVEFPEEDAPYVQQYVDRCRLVAARGGYTAIELKVDYSEWVPEGWGTSDFVHIDTGVLTIRDLKFGVGVRVFAEGNDQLLCYALGTYAAFQFEHDIHTIVMEIDQPRLDHVDTWTITLDELLEHGERLRIAAQATLDPEAPLVAGDKQCQWCPAKERCPANAARLAEAAALFSADVPPFKYQNTLLTLEQVATQVLPLAKSVSDFLEKAHAYAYSNAMDGVEVPGFKLVDGRSSRAWEDEKKAVRVMRKAGLTARDMYVKELLSPAQAEKAVSKEHHPTLATGIVKTPGNLALVPLSDKRKAVTVQGSKASAAEFDD